MTAAPDKHKGSRRQGRTLAFQVLFGLGFVPQEGEAAVRLAFKRNPAVEECELEDAKGFASQLVQGVSENQAEIDKVIGKHSDHWKIGRIGKVELAILRLSLFEILYRSDIPLKVAINEAIELAKSFGDENSRSFVNGILDAVARAVDEGRFDIEKKIDKKPAQKHNRKADNKSVQATVQATGAEPVTSTDTKTRAAK
ncbi:MAG: transcription antitermination factor NusB [Deltaproteobacteria bacterium HGW-Deltaproteobacteria-8]|nr:MAG: transcription antitermination factor NusB [Deltaproteobacteria bacterium HGW-Deltaproteobacteria-8]